MKVEILLNTDDLIRLELYPNIAPKTVENFIKLVNENYYNGTVFHRIINGFMIQTGGYKIENNTLMELGEAEKIEGEFTSNGFTNPLKHELGVISMARTSDPNSATSQFFICAGNANWLDGEYAAFGKTIDEESNEVVLKVAGIQTMNIGGGFTDFPTLDIKIVSIKVID